MIPYKYSTYTDTELSEAMEAQTRNLSFWESMGEEGRVSAADCKEAIKRIKAVQAKRAALRPAVS